ncbi:MAG: ribosome maturation factor RimP [Polyangiales bacterium]
MNRPEDAAETELPVAPEAPKGRDVRAEIERLAEVAVAAHGCEVVQVEWRRETNGWVARVFVERKGHDPRLAVGGVNLDECARVNRDLGQAIEVEELVAHAFNLEVSSPGLERPLAHAADFQRFLGLLAKMTLRETLPAFPGRRVFKGTLAGADGERVRLDDEDVGLVEVPMAAIARAHLVYVPPTKEKPGKQKKKPTPRGAGDANRPTDDRATTAAEGTTVRRP